MSSFVTRFAPSPTGLLHIGGVRTALFNWLFARANKGRFFLRIDDTDMKRSNQGNIDYIMESLHWLGLDWDGIFFQSQRTERYQEVAAQLLSQGQAYKDCAEEGTGVLRFNVKKNERVVLKDVVFGDISVDTNEIDCFALLRSDNTPTYFLASSVDDHDLQISHVLRGNDHLVNTSKQILFFNAMAWREPIFAHMPLIHDENGRKLSKRSPDQIGVMEYKKKGFLPESILLYALRMGWECSEEEVNDISRAKEIFDIQDIGRSPSRLDQEKLCFLNRRLMRQDEGIIKKIRSMMNVTFDDNQALLLTRISECFLERCSTMSEIVRIFEKISFLDHSINVAWNNEPEVIIESLLYFRALVTDLSLEWNLTSIGGALKDTLSKFGIKKPQICHPLRQLIVGDSKAGLGVAELVYCMGRESFGKKTQFLHERGSEMKR